MTSAASPDVGKAAPAARFVRALPWCVAVADSSPWHRSLSSRTSSSWLRTVGSGFAAAVVGLGQRVFRQRSKA